MRYDAVVPRPKGADSEATFNAVMAAAERIVVSGRPLTLRAAAQEAGISLGSLQYYFPNHRALVQACVDEAANDGWALLHQCDRARWHGAAFPPLPTGELLRLVRRHGWRIQLALREPDLLQTTLDAAERWSTRALEHGPPSLPVSYRAVYVAAWALVVARLYLVDDATLQTFCHTHHRNVAREARRRHMRRLHSLWADTHCTLQSPKPREERPSLEVSAKEGGGASMVLAAARAVLANGGELRLSAVARHLDISVSGVRHYFGTRDALVHALIDDHDRAQLRCIRAGVQGLVSGKPAGDVVRETIGRIYELHLDAASIARIRQEDTADRRMSPRVTPALALGQETLEVAAGFLGLETVDFALSLRALGFLMVHFAAWEARRESRGLRGFVEELAHALILGPQGDG